MKKALEKYMLLLPVVLLLGSGCKKSTATLSPERSFYMGVTPWPADFTATDVAAAYAFINTHCDLVSHHFDEGIPYEEAYTNSGWPQALEDDINTRKTNTTAGIKILLSSAALSINRHSKAPYSRYSQTIADNVKSSWEQLPFDDPKVVTAYCNYIIHLAAALHPAYINYGVESNEGNWTDTGFAAYKNFLGQVYTRLRAAFPGVPLLVSFMVNEDQRYLSLAASLLPYTDYIALSAYPYTHVSSSANGNTDPSLFPADFFTRFTNLDTNKPFCFAETGYIAEPLSVPAFSLSKQGTATWQNDYLQRICSFTNNIRGKFIVWFCSKDYDAGNNTLKNLGIYQDLFAFWQDTGFLDENNTRRPAYDTWVYWMQRKKIN